MTPPPDATHEYRGYNGQLTWLKELDQTQPGYPLARVWSWTTKRWRAKRELVRIDRVKTLQPQDHS